MSLKRYTESELLNGLDARGAHADELSGAVCGFSQCTGGTSE